MTHSRRKAALRAYAKGKGLSYQQALEFSRIGREPSSGESIFRSPRGTSTIVDIWRKLNSTAVNGGIDRGIPNELRSLSIGDLDIGAKIHFGESDEKFTSHSHMPEQVIGGTLSADERAMIQLMHPDDRARYLLQKRIQERTEMSALIAQMQFSYQMARRGIISNIR